MNRPLIAAVLLSLPSVAAADNLVTTLQGMTFLEKVMKFGEVGEHATTAITMSKVAYRMNDLRNAPNGIDEASFKERLRRANAAFDATGDALGEGVKHIARPLAESTNYLDRAAAAGNDNQQLVRIMQAEQERRLATYDSAKREPVEASSESFFDKGGFYWVLWGKVIESGVKSRAEIRERNTVPTAPASQQPIVQQPRQEAKAEPPPPPQPPEPDEQATADKDKCKQVQTGAGSAQEDFYGLNPGQDAQAQDGFGGDTSSDASSSGCDDEQAK